MSHIIAEAGGDGDVSRSIAVINPPTNQAAYDAKFARAFIRAMNEPDSKGLLTTYLFYDIPQSRGATFSNLSYDARSILSGGRAWERRVEEAVAEGGNTGYWSKDHSVVAYSLQNGLIKRFPPRAIKFASYGGGDINAFRGNELEIIGAFYDTRPRDAAEFCAVDILERFAFNCALAARDSYGIKSSVIQGDFIYNGELAIPESRATPVVMIFGGPFENTPEIKGANPAQDITALAWAKLNTQHGLGAVVIKTCDTNQTPDLINGPYAPSKNFEAFLLSAFARAVQQGVIEDPQYDVFSHWMMTSAFNQVTKSVELSATCKVDHSVPIGGQTITFKAGEGRVFTLSHKWDEATDVQLAKRAGFDVEVFRQPGNDNILLVAKAVREPDADLLAMMPSR